MTTHTQALLGITLTVLVCPCFEDRTQDLIHAKYPFYQLQLSWTVDQCVLTTCVSTGTHSACAMILTLTLLSTGVVTTVKTSIGQHKDSRSPFASHLECFSIPFRLSWNGEVRKAQNSLSGFKTWLLTVHPSRNQWLDSHLLGVRTDTPTVNIIYHRITGIINFSLNELNSLRLNSANHNSDIIRDLEGGSNHKL